MDDGNSKVVIFFYDMRCPLTGEIMNEPVVASDGRTHERAAIETVIKDRANQTISNEAWLSHVPDLSSNHLYKNMLTTETINIFTDSIRVNDSSASGPVLRRMLSRRYSCDEQGMANTVQYKIPVDAKPMFQYNMKCPILMTLMEDPVIASDGYTYERHAIEAWIKSVNDIARSPSTNEPLELLNLYPNLLARKTISMFISCIAENIKKDDLQGLHSILQQAEIGNDKSILLHEVKIPSGDATKLYALPYSLKCQSTKCYNFLLSSMPKYQGNPLNDALSQLVVVAGVEELTDLIGNGVIPIDQPLSVEGHGVLYYAIESIDKVRMLIDKVLMMMQSMLRCLKL